MNDEQMQPLLEVWLHDRDEAPRDANRGLARVMTRLPEVRQRGRWWPLPVFHRKAKPKTPTTNDMTVYQPSPIPATNGHAPTVIGRTRLMFSPVKAIVAGVLVSALGGMFLIAQPFSQQGGVPGAEQAAEPMAPVYVTSTFIALDCEELSGHTAGTVEEDGPVQRTYGSTCTAYRKWSDPRLQGTETWFQNGVDYWDESELSIGHHVRTIVTDEGTWRMRPVFNMDAGTPLGTEVSNSSGTLVFDGEDDYEGLSLVLADSEGTDPLSGYIISTDLVPPVPEEGFTK